MKINFYTDIWQEAESTNFQAEDEVYAYLELFMLGMIQSI